MEEENKVLIDYTSVSQLKDTLKLKLFGYDYGLIRNTLEALLDEMDCSVYAKEQPQQAGEESE